MRKINKYSINDHKSYMRVMREQRRIWIEKSPTGHIEDNMGIEIKVSTKL